jgi:hypothetical protein
MDWSHILIQFPHGEQPVTTRICSQPNAPDLRFQDDLKKTVNWH